VPALRFIGKRYTDADRGKDGGFGNKWGEWHANGWFSLLESLGPSGETENGYLGLMTISSDDHSGFAYWIGIFFPPDTDVPDGFDFLDLPAGEIGISWIRGDDRTGEIFGGEPHTAAYNKLQENGWDRLNENAGGQNTIVFFERYNCPRYTTRDEEDKVTLDYGFYLA